MGYILLAHDEGPDTHKEIWVMPWVGCVLQEGFGLSSSPGLRRKGAGWDVILPIV